MTDQHQDLPPLPPHPARSTMLWSTLEIEAIRAYARAAIAADLAQRAAPAEVLEEAMRLHDAAMGLAVNAEFNWESAGRLDSATVNLRDFLSQHLGAQRVADAGAVESLGVIAKFLGIDEAEEKARPGYDGNAPVSRIFLAAIERFAQRVAADVSLPEPPRHPNWTQDWTQAEKDTIKRFCESAIRADRAQRVAGAEPVSPDRAALASECKRLIGSQINYPHTPRSTAWANEIFAAIDRLAGAPPAQGKPVAWLRNLTDSHPHAVTDLAYRSAAEAAAGLQYTPVYLGPPALPSVEHRNALVANMTRFSNLTKNQARGIVRFVFDGIKPDPADFASPAPAVPYAYFGRGSNGYVSLSLCSTYAQSIERHGLTPVPVYLEPLAQAEPVAGVVLFEDGPALVKRGQEDEIIRRNGGRRLYAGAPPAQEQS